MAAPAVPANSKRLILDPGLCRCCRSIKKCRFLSAEYEWTGQKEIYSDMFMDCFGLLVSPRLHYHVSVPMNVSIVSVG